jgi:RNase P protein component
MRHRIARALRKWADLVDPHVRPTTDGTVMTVNLRCDTTQFNASLEQARQLMKRVIADARLAGVKI